MLILLSAVQGGETDRLQTLHPLQYSDPLYIIYKFSQTFNLHWGPAGGGCGATRRECSGWGSVSRILVRAWEDGKLIHRGWRLLRPVLLSGRKSLAGSERLATGSLLLSSFMSCPMSSPLLWVLIQLSPEFFQVWRVRRLWSSRSTSWWKDWE